MSMPHSAFMFSRILGVTQPLGGVSHENRERRGENSPVTVGPALVLFDGDHSSLTKLALLDLDLANAIGSLAEGAMVGADLCRNVSCVKGE